MKPCTLGKDARMKFSHLTPAQSQGNWTAGSSCREWVGWVACTSPPTGSLCGKVVETWPISEKIWYSEYPLPLPTLAAAWGHHTAEQKMYPSSSSPQTLVFVLFIVNSVWEQRTFTHLCHICSSFTHRTSFISRAAKSCWTCNWFLQPPVPWQVSLTSFSSKTGGHTKVLACLWSCRKPLAVPGRKKREFLTYSAAVLT